MLPSQAIASAAAVPKSKTVPYQPPWKLQPAPKPELHQPSQATASAAVVPKSKTVPYQPPSKLQPAPKPGMLL
ncbi:unnamed protein product [Rotaria sordida]|uniref:Uncharacterized protein n=1 Tax=Rotaria sordida TaxID=392033 RepID=A0A815G7F6_9BILA|nr:unnamed protein product [Rotaria sordida]